MTHQQARLLAFIQHRLLTEDVSPSYAEIAAGTGIKSKSRIHQIVTALADAGHIRMQAGRHRSITLPDRAADAMPSIREAMRQIIATTSLHEAQKAAQRVLLAVEGVGP